MSGPLAETRAVSKQFGDNRAVDAVTMAVSAGEIVGLVGANGAGKTTLIRMLLGLIVPDEGEVLLFGRAPARATRRRIGYMPQSLGLYEDLTVVENLRFTSLVFAIDPPPLAADLEPHADTLVADLPLGLKRRTAFVAALSHGPELLVLDEPTSGVGPLGRADLWDTIHDAVDNGAGALVTTHHMDEAEQCDRLVFMAGGRAVASGTVDMILDGQFTVEATPADPAQSLAVLEKAGMPVLPAGAHLRVPGMPVSSVRSVIGAEAGLVETQSSLEEAFMTLAGSS